MLENFTDILTMKFDSHQCMIRIETAKYVPKDISVKQLDCNDTCLCHSYLARKELFR